MNPSLEDIQSSLNKACQMILDVSKGLYQWGQDRCQIAAFLAAKESPSFPPPPINGIALCTASCLAEQIVIFHFLAV